LFLVDSERFNFVGVKGVGMFCNSNVEIGFVRAYHLPKSSILRALVNCLGSFFILGVKI